MTAFLIDDFLAASDFHGARLIALSSASSKTAISLAFLLSTRRPRPFEVVGLTSSGNADFVRRLGYYDRVVTYDALDELPSDTPLVFVDMAGNGAVRDAVHRRAGDHVRYSCAVGGTHWGEVAPAGDLPGAPPTFFFAPDRARARIQDWGLAGLQARTGEAWTRFLRPLGGWMTVQHHRGPAAVERVYRDAVDGRADPAAGHVLAL